MIGLLLDTHAAIWTVKRDARLSRAAADSIASTSAAGLVVAVSTITIVEIVYLLERGRIPADTLEELQSHTANPANALKTIGLDEESALSLARVPRDLIGDMPDRILAATALSLNVPLVTRDEKLRAFHAIETIW